MSRSLCLRRVSIGWAECPRYAQTFERDLIGRMHPSAAAASRLHLATEAGLQQTRALLLASASTRAELLEPKRHCPWALLPLARGHPCFNSTAQECHYKYVTALK